MTAQLDPRLQAVAEAVRPGSVVADVGTDHGYLVCALVRTGHCPRGYASDIHSQPLASAQAHIREQGLEGKIQTCLSDGLQDLPGSGIDDIVIAGMGGELIGELLLAVDWTRSLEKRYILQPMTRAEVLRRTLYQEGFALCQETAVISGRFAYTVMTAQYTGDCRAIDDDFAYTGLLLSQSNGAAQRYLDGVRSRLQKQADGLAAGGYPREAEAIYALCHRITEQRGGQK